jgi:hypothetical protein
MYLKEVQAILNKLGGYLKTVGVEAGITTIPYRLHGDYFIKIKDINKPRLKQAANLMSNDHHAFNLAVTKHLKDFAGERGGEYAERAIDVIDKLAELDNLHATKHPAHVHGGTPQNQGRDIWMYDSFAMTTLREVGDYLKSVGIRAGVTSPPSRTYDEFITIVDMDKSKLKQAAKLMSRDSGTFTLAATKRLKEFAGGMGGEYAERAADVIAALTELDNPHASNQREKKVEETKNSATKVHSRLNVLKIFNRVTSNPTNFGGWRGF